MFEHLKTRKGLICNGFESAGITEAVEKRDEISDCDKRIFKLYSYGQLGLKASIYNVHTIFKKCNISYLGYPHISVPIRGQKCYNSGKLSARTKWMNLYKYAKILGTV